MAVVTLAALKTLIEDRGEISDTYVDTTASGELEQWIHGSIAKLYRLMIKADPDLEVSEQTVAVSSAADHYALAADFYRILYVDVELTSGERFPMKRFNMGARNAFSLQSSSRRRCRYRAPVNGEIWLRPSPDWSGNVYVGYAPQPPTLATLQASGFDFISGFEEFVILDVLLKFYAKEESDPGVVTQQYVEAKQGVLDYMTDRDDGEPERVRDVYTEDAGIEGFD